MAFLGHHGIIGLTTFVVNMLASIGIAAGTDYGISSSAVIKRHVRLVKTGNGFLHHVSWGR